MTTEIATVDERPTELGLVIPAGADIMRLSAADLFASAESFEVEGYGLVSDKMTLIGVPFVVVGVRYQKPVEVKNGPARDYVTLESIIGTSAMIAEAEERGLIPGGKCAWKPEERVVINDGSTGIRRQVTKMLQSAGLLNVGEVTDDSSYDRSWIDWESFSQDNGKDGEQMAPYFTRNPNGNQLIIKAFRGLRVSQYTNEYTDEGVTFYL